VKHCFRIEDGQQALEVAGPYGLEKRIDHFTLTSPAPG
jgi:hypothetical protein